MTWLMFELARHPEIQKQVQEHIASGGNQKLWACRLLRSFQTIDLLIFLMFLGAFPAIIRRTLFKICSIRNLL